MNGLEQRHEVNVQSAGALGEPEQAQEILGAARHAKNEPAGGQRPVRVLDLAHGSELRQQLLRGGIELAAVVAKIQFGQVQPEGPSLRQQPLQPAACGAPRALPEQALLNFLQGPDEPCDFGLARSQSAAELRQLGTESLVGLKRQDRPRWLRTSPRCAAACWHE